MFESGHSIDIQFLERMAFPHVGTGNFPVMFEMQSTIAMPVSEHIESFVLIYIISHHQPYLLPPLSLSCAHITDKLKELEKKTGYPKAYFFLAIVSVLAMTLFSLGGAKLVTDLVSFVYPAYMSFKAIDSKNSSDDVQWLTYWVVFSFFSIVESIGTFLVEFIPFYFVLKIGFFIWLYHPKFMGAGLVYTNVVKPFIMPHVKALTETKKVQKKME